MKNPFISDTDYEQSLYNYEMARSSFHSSRPTGKGRAQPFLCYHYFSDGRGGDRPRRGGKSQTVAAGFETPLRFSP